MTYDFDYYSTESMDALLPIASALVAIYLAVVVIGLLVSAVMYVIRSLSLHTISKRRGIHNSWLSWVPVGQEWIIGSLSDQFKYLTQGKNQSRRKILLGLELGSTLLGLVSGFVGVVRTVQGIGEAGYGTLSEEAALQIMIPVMIALVVAVVSAVIGIIAYVFRQMSMYDLYRSCDPKNAVVFLVFGILFGVTEPFFLLACRNKDGGMPPRKTVTEDASNPVPDDNM